jgi:hypothetical protein
MPPEAALCFASRCVLGGASGPCWNGENPRLVISFAAPKCRAIVPLLRPGVGADRGCRHVTPTPSHPSRVAGPEPRRSAGRA